MSNEQVTSASLNDDLEKENQSNKEETKARKTQLKKSESNKVSSRYLQSAKEYPERKRGLTRTKKAVATPSNKPPLASTPFSTPHNTHSTNVSNLSSIGVKSQNSRTVETSSKVTIREHLLPSEKLGKSMMSRNAPMLLLPPGQDSASRKRNVERAVLEAQHLQTLYMKLQAEESSKIQEMDAIAQIEEIWLVNEAMNKKVFQTTDEVHSLERKLELMRFIKAQKDFIEKGFQCQSSVKNNLQFLTNQVKCRSNKTVATNFKLTTHDMEESISSTQLLAYDLEKNNVLDLLAKDAKLWCEELRKLSELQRKMQQHIGKIYEKMNKIRLYEETKRSLDKESLK